MSERFVLMSYGWPKEHIQDYTPVSYCPELKLAIRAGVNLWKAPPPSLTLLKVVDSQSDFSVMVDPFTVEPARYRAGHIAIACPSTDGFKTRAARLASALSTVASKRERAYLLPRAKADEFMRMYLAGWDADAVTNELLPPEIGEPVIVTGKTS